MDGKAEDEEEACVAVGNGASKGSKVPNAAAAGRGTATSRQPSSEAVSP